MSAPLPGSIRERAGAVVDHHYDDTNPHKPLWLMFPGGAVAVVSLLWVVWGFYKAYFAAKIARGLERLATFGAVPVGIN